MATEGEEEEGIHEDLQLVARVECSTTVGDDLISRSVALN